MQGGATIIFMQEKTCLMFSAPAQPAAGYFRKLLF